MGQIVILMSSTAAVRTISTVDPTSQPPAERLVTIHVYFNPINVVVAIISVPIVLMLKTCEILSKTTVPWFWYSQFIEIFSRIRPQIQSTLRLACREDDRLG